MTWSTACGVEKDMGYEGDWVATNLTSYLGPHVRSRRLGRVTTQGGGFQYPELDGGKLHFPDLAFIRAERAQGQPPKRWADFPPDLVVEVVSPNDKAEDVEDKVEMWFDGGAQQVWVIYPAKRRVVVHLASGEARKLRVGDTLTGGDLIPGFEVPVADLFEDFPAES
jgi:Uma2 family endonuclease